MLFVDSKATKACAGMQLSQVFSRLGDAAFTDLLEHWRTLLGDDRFVTFICDGVACRLGEKAFADLLEHWHTLLGDDRFVTFICDSVACRLGEKANAPTGP